MTFMNPSALFGLLLVPVFAWLYLRRAGRREIFVPGLALWQEAVELSGAESGRRTGAMTLPLFLAMSALSALIFAASRPVVTGETKAPENILVIADCSMSMATFDSKGNFYYRATKQTASKLLDELKPTKITLIKLPLEEESIRQDVDSFLSTLLTTPHLVDVMSELTRVSGLAAKASAIVVLTDDPSKVPSEIAGKPVTVISYGEKSRNIAIEAFEVTKSENGFAAFALVKNHSGKDAVIPVKVLVDDIEVEAGRIEIKAGGSAVFTSKPIKGEIIEVHIEADDDGLLYDNKVFAAISASQKISVAYIGQGNPFIFRALELLPQVEVKRYKLAGDVSGGHALYIYDGVVPDALPAGEVMLINPPRSLGAVRTAGVVSNPDGIRAAIAKETPLLTDISDVRFKRLLQLELGEDADILAASEDSRGVVLARTKDGDTNVTVVGCGLDLSETNWPMHPSFPIFWSELVSEIAGGQTSGVPVWYNTGDLIPVAPDAEVTDYTFGENVDTVVRGGRAYFIPKWPGIYTAGDVKYAVNVIHPSESANDGVTQVPSEIKTVENTAAHRPLWRYFAAAGLLLAFAFWGVVRVKGE